MESLTISEDTQAELKCLKSLKNSVKENQEFDQFSPIINDKFLMPFIRGSKNDSKRAFKTVKTYFSIRKSKADFFTSIKPSTNFTLNAAMYKPLKHTDRLNRLVIVAKIRLWDPTVMSTDDLYHMIIMILEEMMGIEAADKNGIVVIFDLAEWTTAHAKACTPNLLLNAFYLFWGSIPLRYKVINIVNEGFVFSMMLKTVKLFLPKKLADRIHCHSTNLKSLHEKVCADILPESLGGNLKEEEAFDEEFIPRIQTKDKYYETFAQCIKSNSS